MPLSPGDKLGPYEILSPLGAGGMGEVYKARDTRLDRSVAIKTSKSEFTERFEREARAVAALNHPNICQLYDVGPNYLVMELIDGTPLKGPLPLDKAIEAASQILDALDAAHCKGITHRDLKPANILSTKQGIKLLDFGLATQGATLRQTDNTITTEGQIVGTLQYMAPEQLQGKPADARSDIFSFGCVLYELLSGKRAFQGDSPASIIAAILERDPQPLDTTPPLARLIRKCLAKDPDDRFQNARDLKYNLTLAPEASAAAKAPSRWPWAVAALLLLATIAASYTAWRATRPIPKPLINLTLDLGPDAQLDSVVSGANFLLSPDGTRIAYIVKNGSGIPVIATRTLDQDQLTLLPGTENASTPFFSPDGQWIAFFASNKLKKAAVSGGASFTLCDSNSLRGGTWTEDGNIVAALDIRSGFSVVPSNGGTPTPLTKLEGEEKTHRWPHALPGGAVLFMSDTSPGNYEDGVIEIFSPRTGQRKVLHRGGYFPRYTSSGHLLFMSQGGLLAAPLNLDRLELTSAPVPILNNIQARPGSGSALFHVSANGTLLFRKGSPNSLNQSLVWLDKQGNIERIPLPPAPYRQFQLTPDDRQISLASEVASLSIYDVERNTLNGLNAAASSPPIWSPSLSHVIYRSTAGISARRSDGGGKELALTNGRADWPSALSPDGSLLFFHRDFKYWALPLDWSDPAGPKSGTARALPIESSRTGSISFSPDGRWIAYHSDDSGRHEIYVRASPTGAKISGRWQISAEEASIASPVWSPNGKEILYRNAQGQILVVPYTVNGDVFVPSKSYVWENRMPFNGSHSFDLSRDGKRLLISGNPDSTTNEGPAGQLVIQLNFLDDLKRRVPAN